MSFSSEAAGGVPALVPAGLPADGLCVFITSRCESSLRAPNLSQSYYCSVSVFRDAVSLLPRWKCRGRSSCCHSWRRWAARVSTDCPTPPPQSASPAWLIRNRRVSFYAGGFLLKSPPGSFGAWEKKWFGIRDLFLSSSGDSLDKLIQNTTKRVCCELESPSSAVRTQAFTLMVWVRDAEFIIFFNGKLLNLLIAFKLLMLFYSSEND